VIPLLQTKTAYTASVTRPFLGAAWGRVPLALPLLKNDVIMRSSHGTGVSFLRSELKGLTTNSYTRDLIKDGREK